MRKNLFLFIGLLVLGFALAPVSEQGVPSLFSPEQQALPPPTQPQPSPLKRPSFPKASWVPLPDISGKKHSLSDHVGRVILVNFWASWCAPCLLEIPSMLALAEENPDHLHILFVSVDRTSKDAQNALKRLGQKMPANVFFLYDSSQALAQFYGIEKFPETLWIAPDLTVRSKTRGLTEWMAPAIQEKINTLFEESKQTDITP